MLQKDPWKPHPLSPKEIQKIRKQSSKLLKSYLCQRAYVRLLEDQPVDPSEEPEQHALVVHKYKEKALKTYTAYQLIFWRTFHHDLLRELLSNIIRFVFWSAPSSLNSIRWRLQLTWVLRYFRNIAISDATLWNAIWFCDKPPFERSLAFVGRSRTSPLDLRLDDTLVHKFTDLEICALLKDLTPHLHHIRVLIILLEDWEPILSVLKWLSDYGKEGILATSPMLMKLSLDGAGPASSNPTTISNLPTINLPHLHTLVLANFAAPFTTNVYIT
ncbi:hypothetical protein C8R42DRAFT_725410 [Lentinula raphanica]|nr:hypothetical protein C8R42DRAFT_725410 [Lentinula raphanica]